MGFSLVELMLSLSLGLWLSGTILQMLLSEGQLGLRVNRLLRERHLQQRTLALVRSDVQRASRISSTPQLEQHACTLAGRLPVLHLSTAAGAITYSIGDAPSAIWRGQVLMRCGPAFDLQGQIAAGSSAQNRVLIDGLALKPEPWQGCTALLGSGIHAGEAAKDLAGSAQHAFSGCLDGTGLRLALRLVQEFPGTSGRSQRVNSEVLVSPAV